MGHYEALLAAHHEQHLLALTILAVDMHLVGVPPLAHLGRNALKVRGPKIGAIADPSADGDVAEVQFVLPHDVPLYSARRHARIEVQVDGLGDRLAAGPLPLEAQVVGEAPAAVEAPVPLDVVVLVVTEAVFQRIGGTAMGAGAGVHRPDMDGFGRFPDGFRVEAAPDHPYMLALGSPELEAKAATNPAAVGARHPVPFARLRVHDMVVGADAVDQYSRFSLVCHSHTVMAYRRLKRRNRLMNW